MTVPVTIQIETRTGNTRVKGRRSAPKAQDRRVAIHNNHIAYTFSEPQVGKLEVLNSDKDAWWVGDMGKVKIQKLIDAWKIDANDDEACFYAGISSDQLKYFQKLHPDLYTIKHRCRQNLGLIAKTKFAKQVESGEASLTYLRLKRKDEGYNPRIEVAGVNVRELIEKESEERRKLTEEVRAIYVNKGNDVYVPAEEHTSGTDADVDAGQVGDRHETAPTENTPSGT